MFSIWRCITGCLRPTNVDSLYVLAGIAPPGVRRSVASRTERRRQADDTRHPCHNHQPAPSRLKSRKSFLHAVQPLSQPPQAARLTLWEEQRIAKQHLAKLPIPTSEQLAPGHKSEWKLWKSLNRLRTGMGRSKTNLSKWGYADTADTACECGTSEQTMQHLLRCPLLENECSLEDLATANEKALHCARAWPNMTQFRDDGHERSSIWRRAAWYDETVLVKYSVYFIWFSCKFLSTIQYNTISLLCNESIFNVPRNNKNTWINAFLVQNVDIHVANLSSHGHKHIWFW